MDPRTPKYLVPKYLLKSVKNLNQVQEVQVQFSKVNFAVKCLHRYLQLLHRKLHDFLKHMGLTGCLQIHFRFLGFHRKRKEPGF